MHGRIVQIDWQDEEASLKRLYLTHKDAIVKARLHLLWLVRSGKQVKEATQIVGCHARTAQQWLAWYRQGGLELVQAKKGGNYKGASPRLSSGQTESLIAQANKDGFESGLAVRDYIKQTFGVTYKVGGVYSLLKRLKVKKKVPRPMNVKADEAVPLPPSKETFARGNL